MIKFIFPLLLVCLTATSGAVELPIAAPPYRNIEDYSTKEKLEVQRKIQSFMVLWGELDRLDRSNSMDATNNDKRFEKTLEWLGYSHEDQKDLDTTFKVYEQVKLEQVVDKLLKDHPDPKGIELISGTPPLDSKIPVNTTVLYTSKDDLTKFPVVVKEYITGTDGKEQILVVRKSNINRGFIADRSTLTVTDVVLINPEQDFLIEIGEKVQNRDGYPYTIKGRQKAWHENFYLIQRSENGQTWDQVLNEDDFYFNSNLSYYK